MRVLKAALAGLATLALLSACIQKPEPSRIEPQPSHEAVIKEGDYKQPLVTEATGMGFAQKGEAKRVTEILPTPPVSTLNVERYLPDWHHFNLLHPYVTQKADHTARVTLWAHDSSDPKVDDRVHLFEFSASTDTEVPTFVCTGPLLKKGVGLDAFLKQLRENLPGLPLIIEQYKFVKLVGPVEMLCVRKK